MVVGDNGIGGDKKCRQIDNDFDPHANGALWRDVHHLMERIRGFIQSH
jgi:hypothetical protein